MTYKLLPPSDFGLGADGYYTEDVFYRLPDGTGFVSPDGVGRYFYDSYKEAAEQHGPMKIRSIEQEWDGNIPYTREDYEAEKAAEEVNHE